MGRLTRIKSARPPTIETSFCWTFLTKDLYIPQPCTSHGLQRSSLSSRPSSHAYTPSQHPQKPTHLQTLDSNSGNSSKAGTTTSQAARAPIPAAGLVRFAAPRAKHAPPTAPVKPSAPAPPHNKKQMCKVAEDNGSTSPQPSTLNPTSQLTPPPTAPSQPALPQLPPLSPPSPATAASANPPAAPSAAQQANTASTPANAQPPATTCLSK